MRINLHVDQLDMKPLILIEKSRWRMKEKFDTRRCATEETIFSFSLPKQNKENIGKTKTHRI